MIPNAHYKMQKMPYGHDTLVTTAQEEAGEMSVLGPSMILDPCHVKKGIVNPHLKMVAKVFPWTVRGQDKTETEAEEDVIFDKMLAKKQSFPWFSKLNVYLKDAFGKQNYHQLDQLMDLFISKVTEDVKSCYKKSNRAGKLKTKMIVYLRIFHTMYSEVKQPVEYDHYADKMSCLLSMYLDMEIRASRRNKESPRAIALRLTSTMFILLGHAKSYILEAIMNAKLFTKSYSDICIPIIMAVVNDIPRELDEVAYIHYILIFKKWKTLVRKEERAEINRIASLKLSPPLGFAEVYDSDKYSSKQLHSMAQGNGDTFTLMLMRDSGLSVKSNSKGGSSQAESTKDNESKSQDFDVKLAELGEEYSVKYEEETNKDQTRTEVTINQTWDLLLNICPDDHEENFFSILEEDDITEDLKRWQEKEERKLMEAATAKLAIKEKKNKLEDGVSALSSMPKRSPECFGFLTVKTSTIASQAEPLARTQNEVPKKEANSQSQNDNFVYNFDAIAQRIKIEPEDRDDDYVSKSDLTPPTVLKAVVRPESTEYHLSNSTNVDKSSSIRKEEAKIVDGFAGFSSEPEKTDSNESSEVLNSRNLAAEKGPMEVSSEERVLEDRAPSTANSAETNQPNSAPESLLEEFPKYTLHQQNGLLGMESDGENNFSEILDPNGDILFSSEELNESNVSYWPTQDFFLGQYEDGFFSYYENGGVNQPNNFPDFYNDQQDLVFTEANLMSPPMLGDDEPVEYQLTTTHWDDLSEMVDDSTEQERLSSPEAQDGPIVVFMDKPKKKSKGKAKSKAKAKARTYKEWFQPEIDPAERKCKLKYAEEESKRVRQPPRRKRARQDEEEEVVEEDEVEPEPQPKKTKGRQKKQPTPSPPTPPPTNTKKPRGGSQAQGVTKKKAQSRRRK